MDLSEARKMHERSPTGVISIPHPPTRCEHGVSVARAHSCDALMTRGRESRRAKHGVRPSPMGHRLASSAEY